MGMATHAVAGVPVADGAGTRWLSANPDKAWGERFFLAYSPIWMIAFGVYLRTRVGDRLGALVVAVAAWFWARAEISLTTSPSLADQFRYEDLAWALRWGALVYACYFIVSFPMVSRLDERPEEVWTVRRTIIEALAAGMLTFILLDLVTAWVGARYR